ncbi:LysR substrate-binding domain-containing protein [Paracoccus aminophilus]|uniref:Transcriptional regulator, LysR family n=1 Tax=Paracoccus aminophilus JCM 7686 TaxID=1367847 RepID=S5XWS9_PARAH|nr:LysR substrate-binding domain-containing protein [Paracoccus aminophilus]AGT09762.1 transcriptional regulator, LysR family [Paracoccus aminophilus JCM 7686]
MSNPHDLVTMAKAYTPTLSELQAFVACGKTLSTTDAAKELGLTQSAVSRAVISLENRMGVALFHRARQRLSLSDTGRAFLPDAEAILSDLDRSVLRAMAFGSNQVIRLACLPTLAERWLVPRLHSFSQLAPQVTFDIASRLDMPDFAKTPFDLAIHHLDQAPPGSEATPLMDEYLIAIASPALARQIRFDTHAQDLTEESRLLTRYPLLQQETRPHLWLDWFGASAIDPVTFTRGARFAHFGMVVTAARAGMGVGLVPELLVEDELRLGTLDRVSDRRMRGSTYALIEPARRGGPASDTEFRDWLIREAQRHAD